jgi:hypothetical protein
MPIVMKSGSLILQEFSRSVQACTGIALHIQFGSLRGAGVLAFIGILYNGRTELNLARGMDVCHVGPGRQRTYDGLILLSETSYSTSQWNLEKLGFSSTGL